MQPIRNTGWIGILVIGVIAVACTLIISSTIVKVKGFNQTITVTGAASMQITSDLATWEGVFSIISPTLETGYDEMDKNRKIVQRFMSQEGFEKNDYVLGTVQMQKLTNREQEFKGYAFKQSIKVQLQDVERVTALAQNASTLIREGVEFQSQAPRYLFTGLDAMKLDLIEAATINAQARAERLAKSTNKNVGGPRSAKVGVFQIRALHSQRVSGYGIYDVTTIEKEIVCTVHVSFSFE